jgi:predicted RNA methylase
MNEADIKLLQGQDIDMEILRALMKIQHDLRLLVDRVESIEQMMISPPHGWDDIEVTNPPF